MPTIFDVVYLLFFLFDLVMDATRIGCFFVFVGLLGVSGFLRLRHVFRVLLVGLCVACFSDLFVGLNFCLCFVYNCLLLC